MMTKRSTIVWFVGLLTAGLLLASPAIAGDNDAKTPEPQSEAVDSVQDQVDDEVADETSARREKVLSNAEAAVRETRTALTALNDEKTEEAIAALERATGKLELVVAREPELALAPAGVTVRTHDLFARRETIEQMIDQAGEYMDDGEIQDARALITNLASEVVISVSHIPLATYPDAIKAAAPLIDEGKIEEAKRVLNTALSTLVVTDYVHPLPLIRAEKLLAEAESLAEEQERTEEESESLANYLDDARKQVEIAELLGYGENDTFEQFYGQIEEIESKVEGGSSGTDFFDAINATIDEWRQSFLDG